MSNNLAEFRKKSGYPQKFVAAELGVSQQAVAKWESGKGLPRADKLVELAKLYGCTVDVLLESKTKKGA